MIVDYSFGRPSASALLAANVDKAMRYLSWPQNGAQAKVLTDSERAYLLNNRIDIGLAWEYDSQDALGGYGGGVDNGKEALRQARALGYPANATIYFAYDFDVNDAQKPICLNYAKGVKVGLNGYYRAGGYGGYWIIRYLFDNDGINDGWQTYAWSSAVSGVNPGPKATVVNLRGFNYWFDVRANLRQVQNGVQLGGYEVDENTSVGPLYTWLHPYFPVLPSSKRNDFDMLLGKVTNDPACYVGNGIESRHVLTMPALTALAKLTGDIDVAGHLHVPEYADLASLQDVLGKIQ